MDELETYDLDDFAVWQEQDAPLISAPDMYEIRQQAIEFFNEQLEKNKKVQKAIRRIYWRLWEGIGGWSDEDCELVSDWLDDLTFSYVAWEVYDAETDTWTEGDVESLDANDFRAEIVGKEVAEYV